ncbi:MAG: acetate kinase [Candidatus Latescibacteria bacterium]|jgi:acetate kinase|nr:acetate kinase [Candidatus Latescibacterota bacterium]
MHILVINCGSSSVKTRLFDMNTEQVLASIAIEKIGQDDATLINGDRSAPVNARDHETAIAHICDDLPHHDTIAAVGHRVVHGGEQFIDAARVTPHVEQAIDDLSAFAPLHNPHNLAGIRSAQKLFPQATHVAVFDTAFHQSAPDYAYLYALPYHLYEQDRIRRYGFHGTSHRYVSQRAAEILGKPFTGITCHLGNGCSITAIREGQSVDTSMGFTPLEGVAMGTRSGDLDPALVLNLARRLGIDETDKLVNRESGLLGLSGLTNDVRELQQAQEKGNAQAALALNVFAYRIRKYIGAYLTVLGSIDGIIFTGGIGENSADLRTRILSNLEPLGICLNKEHNDKYTGKEGIISAETSPIKLIVIPTDEERLIARESHKIAQSLSRKREKEERQWIV